MLKVDQTFFPRNHTAFVSVLVSVIFVSFVVSFFLSMSVHSVAVTRILSFTFHFVATVSAKFCNVIKGLET